MFGFFKFLVFAHYVPEPNSCNVLTDIKRGPQWHEEENAGAGGGG